MARATVFLITLMCVLPSEGSAQAVPTRESPVDALEAGQRVRVRAADALSIEGVFLGREGPDMLMSTTSAEQAQRVSVDRLEALWVRRRATGKGAKIGAISGGVLGIGVGIFLDQTVFENLDCGGEPCDDSSTFLVAGFFGGLGAIAGAVPGALIGYLVRGWSPVMHPAFPGSEEARMQRPVRDDVDRKNWDGVMTGGYSAAVSDAFGGGSSVGFTAGLYRMRSPILKLGFEAGYDRLGGYKNTYFDIHGPGISQIEKFDWSVLHAAAVARAQPAWSSIRPVGIVGLGAYMVRTRDDIEAFDQNGVAIPMWKFFDIQTKTLPGATVGLGVELPNAWGRWTVGAEARWHGIFDLGPGGVLMGSFTTIAFSVGFD